MITRPHFPPIVATVTALILALLPACSQAKDETPATIPTPPEGSATAIFAGGCFWCMESPFEKLDGVHSVFSGYTGGPEVSPTYKDVSYGHTGHREAVLVTYDPSKITYTQLLDTFWRSIDPTQDNGQFADIGPHYKTGIYYASETEKSTAEASMKALTDSGKFSKPIVVEILPASKFYPAEEYHQDYYKTNSAHYKAYRKGSGREGFLKRTWKE